MIRIYEMCLQNVQFRTSVLYCQNIVEVIRLRPNCELLKCLGQ